MIRDRTIICVASNWSEHPTSKHHVMRILSEQNRVLWINYHASRRPQLNRHDAGLVVRRLREAWSKPRRVASTIDVLTPLLLPLPEWPLARRLNAWLIARQIAGALRRQPSRPTQLWLFTPDVPELIDRLTLEKVVYYCVDDFAAFSGYNRDLIRQLEHETITRADVIFATSQTLCEHCRQQHPSTHLAPHGVDFEHFASTARIGADQIPDDLRAIPKPVFGYFGLIGDYVDLELIATTARQRSDWSFVLLGALRCNAQPLNGLPNVHLLGPRPYEELPRYCRGFDVGLIHFSVNRLTRAANPIKLREYLAAGLPVVSSPLPEVLRYVPAVQVAETAADFPEACARALAAAQDGHATTRRDLVRSEGWRPLVEQLAAIVTDAAPPQRERPPAITAAVRATRRPRNGHTPPQRRKSAAGVCRRDRAESA